MGQGKPLFRRIAAVLLGLLGVGLFGTYVLALGVGRWPRGAPAAGPAPWLLNLLALLLFAGQHSGMARPAVKARLRRFVPEMLERPAYVAASGLALILLVALWQPLPGADLWQGPPWIVGVSLLAVVLTGACYLRFDPGGFLGLRPPRDEGLRVDGPYRWVRHPLMTGTLVFLWAQPSMPPELFLLNVGLTAYILIALRWEEGDLVRRFGEAYRTYRRHVPALLPWRGPYVPGPGMEET